MYLATVLAKEISSKVEERANNIRKHNQHFVHKIINEIQALLPKLVNACVNLGNK